MDPSTLNPAPPAEFSPVCFRDGSHITCDIAFSEPDVVDAPSGIVCGGTELLISLSRSVVGKRTYDADGNLLQRHFREAWSFFGVPDSSAASPVMADMTVIALREHRKHQVAETLLMGAAWTDQGLVFCGSTADRCTRNG